MTVNFDERLEETKRQQVINDSINELEFTSLLNIVAKYCYSDLGRDIISNLKPSSDVNQINFNLNLIQDFQNLLNSGEEIPFHGLYDTNKSVNKSKIQGAILGTEELLNIKDNIKTFRVVKNYFRVNDSNNSNNSNILELLNNVFDNRILEKHIEDAIDDNGNIKDNATKELSRIRSEIRAKSGSLRNRIQKILKKTIEDDIVNEDFYTIRDGRFVIPINVSHKKRLPGIIHGLSQTGTTVFIEPQEIIETNNDLSILRNEEQREIYKILEGLTAEVGSDAERILESTEIFASFDSMIARARYANEFGGFKPIINIQKSKLIFHKIYHPLIVKNLGKSNTTPLSANFSIEKRGHLISGPNAGGKTVALKSIGLNLLMALSGIFPLGECEVCYLDVFTSIGDHQSIENNLSTFSSQIKQLKEIIDYATTDSLVLIDEICSGTDPQEGGALAQAILDTFIDRNLYFIVTTHQSSLKTYALNKAEIENASLEFDAIKLKPTYKFLSGVPGNSYAFHLSKSFGMPDFIINNAKSYLGDRQNELEQSIEIISKYRNEAIQLKDELEKDKQKLNNIIKDYQLRSDELKAKKKKIVEDAKIEAAFVLNNANKLVENTIREIREKENDYTVVKKTFENEKNNLNKEVKEIHAKNAEDENKTNNIQQNKHISKATNSLVKDENLKIGDKVKYSNDNSDDENYGIILEIDKNTKNALVEFNGLKFKIKLGKLNKFEGKIAKKRAANLEHIRFDAKTQIDVRGFRADEAIKTVDSFISDAILTNVHQLTILHGKGTGALRSSLQEFLKYHYQVNSFRDGRIEEGGAGVTIVEL